MLDLLWAGTTTGRATNKDNRVHDCEYEKTQYT